MSLENKKIQMHIAKVYAAKVELEYRLEQRLDEIENIKRNILLQEEEEQRLTKLIKE